MTTGRQQLHATLGQDTPWGIDQGRLLLGQTPLSDWLARQTRPDTPAYVYYLPVIAAQIAALRAILPPGLRLHYAVKANPHPQILRFLAELIDGFDTASAEEIARIAACAPTKLGHTSLAGPAKSIDEIDAAIAQGVLIYAESAAELDRIAQRAARTGQRARIGLRINPPFELKGAGMKMGGGARPFGIDSEQIPALLRRLSTDTDWASHLDWYGFHLFSGSQNRHAPALAQALSAGWELMQTLAEYSAIAPRHLNLGGGFGLPYQPNDSALDLSALAEPLRQITEAAQARWPGIYLNLELGRYLVAPAGMYVTRVVERKISRGKTFLLCDGGLHHHLALSGNLGQVLRRNWPLIAVDHLDTAASETVDLAGPLCTPLDVLGQDQALPPLQAGDVIAVLQSGAYGLTASPQAFLSRPACAEYVVE
ncbi:pyridoxal-dependent decarboxylase, exosortase A system-associated [Halothiobacillus sp. DCM-1]|uniref:pyridoxal-dependent decarboxylase, exosortase A system-associated n=1 Tax=Halothiobacillus sp. DCM-1 TaxID=3112558 RepID=UPI0032555D7D